MRRVIDFFTGGEAVEGARASIPGLKAMSVQRGLGRKKGERAVQELEGCRKIVRRHFMKLLATSLGIAGAGTGAVMWALSSDSRARKELGEPDVIGVPEVEVGATDELSRVDYSRIHPVRLSSQDPLIQAYELKPIWEELSLQALNRFKDADPRVSELLEFMQENAFYSAGGGMAVFDEEQLAAVTDNPLSFNVIFMPEAHADQMSSAILTEPSGKVVRIAADFRIYEWYGIILAHELSHVWDKLVGGEDSSDPDQYLAGEVKAHLLEMKLLEHWDPKAYKILIERGIPLYKRHDSAGLTELFQSLYPLSGPDAASSRVQNVGSSSCLVAVVFEYAMQVGVDEEGLKEVYHTIAMPVSGDKIPQLRLWKKR